jgi:cobalt/nickel transport system permease protein
MNARWLGSAPPGLHSPVHVCPAAVKLGGGLVLIGGTVALPLAWTGWYIGAGVVLLLVLLVSRLPFGLLLRRLAMLAPLVLGVALVNAWQPAARLTLPGLLAKSSVCLCTVLLVTNTTPFGDILRVLRRLRIPPLLITTLALMHRYLYVLAEESERMRRARASRTFRAGRRWQWQTLATVIGQLFLRATQRAERIYDAMCARGWR